MKKYSLEFKWALIYLVTGLVWIVMEKAAGLHDVNIAKHAQYTSLFAIPVIAIYILALYEKRKVFYNGFMSWQDGFKTGIIISIFISILVPVNQLITHYIISPDYFHNVIEEAIRIGALTREQALENFSITHYFIKSITGALLMGAVSSAIAALIMMRKEKIH